jgi:hypothetical protein
MMKSVVSVITFLGFCSVFAEKTRITVYNKSSSTILVALDIELHAPAAKSNIESGQARNFFLPALQPTMPFYCIIDSEGERKQFTISLDPLKKYVILTRGANKISVLDERLLHDEGGGIKIVYYGSLEPAVPEVELVRN